MSVLSGAGLLVALVLLVFGVGSEVKFVFAYPWPIKPFDRQHPIRGGFGDPRTLARDDSFGETRPNDGGDYSFHDGIDITAKPGTPVYPVLSGRVTLVARNGIAVASSNKRSFRYWHVRVKVKLGQHVVAQQTVLGWVRRPFDHVHFGEVDDFHAESPLAVGHLVPYNDHTTPRAIALDVNAGGAPKLTQGGPVSKLAHLAIEALDPPAIPPHGAYATMPQAPALVEWRLRSGREWSAWNVAVDFRKTVPFRPFWSVYTPGTYQNFPIFDHRLYWGVPGRYLFRIDLKPRTLAPGSYELEARVSDVRGNSSTKTWTIQIPAKGSS